MTAKKKAPAKKRAPEAKSVIAPTPPAKPNFGVRSRWDSSVVLWSGPAETIREAMEIACRAGADLRGADLGGANLRSADLRSADLRSANLGSADLRGANLGSANLRGADLRSADIRSADIRGADLGDADLRGADIRGADIRGANLGGADIRSADLGGADLRGAKNSELAIAMTRILPEGDLVGWKRCNGGVIVQLRIPAEAKRSHAFGRKCRAEYADVVAVFGGKVGVTKAHGPRTEYRKGERITPDSWNPEWTEECSHGVHFFITRLEAENYR